MAGDIEVQDASPVVADDEQTVEQAERDRRNGKEIHGRNRVPVIPKEGEPTCGWLRISRRPFHPTRNGSLRDIEAELFPPPPASRVGLSASHPPNAFTRGPKDDFAMDTLCCCAASSERTRFRSGRFSTACFSRSSSDVAGRLFSARTSTGSNSVSADVPIDVLMD